MSCVLHIHGPVKNNPPWHEAKLTKLIPSTQWIHQIFNPLIPPLCYWCGCTLITYPTGSFLKQPAHLHIPPAVDCWVDIVALLCCCFHFRPRTSHSCDHFLNLATEHTTERGGGNTSSTPVKTDLLAFWSATQLQGLVCPEPLPPLVCSVVPIQGDGAKRCHFCSVLTCSKNHWGVC